MAGMAERHSMREKADDFWSWREAMYQLALTISPDDLYHIARMLYAEMLLNGYTQVAEFHYVHHDKDGKPYSNLSAMSEALIAAAQSVGIKITLVPIFYQKGGFGVPPNERQRRFISATTDDYLKLLDAVTISCKNYHFANSAIGIHSLRGVEPKEIPMLLKMAPNNLPVHIHIAEQLKEIEDAIHYLHKRPVEWMLDKIELNDRFHFVHATHINFTEAVRLAGTKTNVVLCPSTEGNLGDGIFPLRTFQSFGGNWSIGTDSHIGINPLEELRLLDYGQRLITHKRNTFIADGQEDSGLFAFTKATLGGRKAMNNYDHAFFAKGQSFDACVVDAQAPLLQSVDFKHLASTILYTTDARHMLCTFVGGKRVNETLQLAEIKTNFKKTISTLFSR
jgi:formiminoglutamate deiminase